MGYSLEESKARMRAMYGENKEIVGEYYPECAVKCRNGVFIGRKKENILSFKGIPFAKPPVGDLRWKAPVPCDDSDEVREAHYFGKSAVQTELFSERGSLYPQSEDCLYLNVWKNLKYTGDKRPVMVFIHGGSYGWGATSDPLYEGSNFVKRNEDIILVTISYRLGMMGFLDLSVLPDSQGFEDSTNCGLLDQILALKWVKENISEFGGDPDNVTVFGESAGAGSVSLLCVMPQAKGLFHRAIIESGAVNLSTSKEDAARLTKRLVKYSGCQSVEELMKLSEEEIKRINKNLNDFNNFPIRDERIVPLHPYGEYKRGVAKDIDIMIGTNAGECRYWIREVGGFKAYKMAIPLMFETYMKKFTQEERRSMLAYLTLCPGTRVWKYTEFFNDILFRVPSVEQAAYHSSAGGNAYVYLWKYPSEIQHMGACHAVELAYVFNNPQERIYTGNNIDRDLLDTTQQMWTSFARTGRPTANGMDWLKYKKGERETCILDSITTMEQDPMQARRVLIKPLIRYYLEGCYTNLDLNVPYVYGSGIKIAAAIGAGIALMGAIIGLIKKD